jgi:hypothetical protein
MPERDESLDRQSPPKAAPRRDGQGNVPKDAGSGRSQESDTEEESTPSRPHGTTEDPDRTL